MYSFYNYGFVNRSVNKNARIVSRVTKNYKYRTETSRRDEDTMSAAVSTDRNGATRMFIDMPDGQRLALDGRQARTLHRLLGRHYGYTNKSV